MFNRTFEFEFKWKKTFGEFETNSKIWNAPSDMNEKRGFFLQNIFFFNTAMIWRLFSKYLLTFFHVAGNGTETSSGKTRQRRSTDAYLTPPYQPYYYPKPEPVQPYYQPQQPYYYPQSPSYGYYQPQISYYQPAYQQQVSLYSLFNRNPAFKDAYLGHHFATQNAGSTPPVATN